MVPIGGVDAKSRRKKYCCTAMAPDGIAECIYADPAKTLAMTYIGKLICAGHAEWRALENGEVELRFFTGELFLLANTTIIRLI
jgi:hypothetical protein